MRRMHLSGVLAGLAMLATACGDQEPPTTNDEGTIVNFTVSVSLPGVVPVSSAHVLATRAGGGETLDTVIQLTPGSDLVLTFTAAVQLQAGVSSESFTASLTLRNASGSDVFEVAPTAVTISEGAILSVTATYVGVGANATTVDITSTTLVLQKGATVTLEAAASAGGQVVSGTPVVWRSLDVSRATFGSAGSGVMTAGNTSGPVSVIAALLTGPADTVTVSIVTGPDSLVLSARRALEDALFLAKTQVVDPEPFLPTNLDRVSFRSAKDTFELAAMFDPSRQTAHFGIAVTTVLALEDNPAGRAIVDSWKPWDDAGLSIEDLTRVMGGFPSTVADHQAALRDVVRPALATALEELGRVDSTGFTFIITPRMQGEPPGSGSPRELDRTDVLGMRAGLEALIAGIDIALAYQGTPSPYGPSGFQNAMALGSTFGRLASDGASRLTAARQGALRAISLARQALASLQAETDNQADDVVKYDAAAVSGFSGFDDFVGSQDVQDAQRFLNDADLALQGIRTIDNFAFNFPLFFTNPLQDLKTFLPAYEVTAGGDFFWTALSFDEWTFPDPTFGGILSDVTSSANLKSRIDLEDLYDDRAHGIARWRGIVQSPNENALYALTERGALQRVPGDFSTQAARPALPLSNQYHDVRLTADPAQSLLIALTDDGLYTRPADASTAWTLRIGTGQYLTCCAYAAIVKSPVGTTFSALDSFGSLTEISANFGTLSARPSLPQFATAMAANDVTGELVGLTVDGQIYARPADASTDWTLRTLIFPQFSDWVGVTQGPTDGRVFAVGANGTFVELSADLATTSERPAVPATHVVALTVNRITGDLVAMTDDGRIFTRPADSSTPWTLRLTLPRTVVF